MLLLTLINSKFPNKKFPFSKKYYEPDLPLKLINHFLKLANTSIDISDGLIDDLKKMINRQNFSFNIFEEKIPVSKTLSKLIKIKKLKKINITSRGDDYQILFTASPIKSGIIKKISKNIGVKITKIGKIISGKNNSKIISIKNEQIEAKNKGYIHRF